MSSSMPTRTTKPGQEQANYFVMSCEGIVPGTMIGTFPKIVTMPWMTGQPVKGRIPEPLEFELDPAYPGKLKPFYKGRIPLMRDDLIAALRTGGVDNLQLFKAVLTNPFENTEHTDYKAFNIIGAIAAADLERSKAMFPQRARKIDMTFDTLAIDEGKIGGPLMFRLAESVNAIMVHAKVKRVVEESGIPGMTFYRPEEWAG
jgi:hypothetical protein